MQGKLDKSLVPLHYTIHLAPSFTTFTFSGKVDINCELRQPTDRIHINAKQLTVEAVTVTVKEVEVEEEEKQRSRKSPSSSGSRSPLPDQDDEGGDEEDHEAKSGDDKKGASESEESNRSGRGKVSRLQEDWDDDDEEEEEEVHEAETDNKEITKSVDNENISDSSQLNSSRITQREGSDLSNDRENFADCSDNSDESNSSVSIGAVKRKSANDSIDGSSDNKYKKSDEDHWTAQTQQNWGVWQDDEVYAVSDDEDKEGDRCRLGKRSQIESQVDHSEDIVQVDGADSDMEDGEEPWHLVKTSQNIVEVSSFIVLEDRELLEINLQTSIQPCHLTISVTYSGTLDDSMRGFYRTHHPEGWGAACHFEATGARKCFPCIDQPEFRTTFDISVRRPSPCHTVLSNMPAKDEDSSGVVSFARTPEMPTYLVCVIVGFYSSLSHRTQCGVPVSVFTPSGRTR